MKRQWRKVYVVKNDTLINKTQQNKRKRRKRKIENGKKGKKIPWVKMEGN